MEELKNYTYRLIEVKDDMTMSLDNVKNIIAEQTTLNELIVNADEKKQFEKFVAANTEHISELNTQVEILETRLLKLTELIELCEKEEIAVNAVALLVEAFGIF